MDVREYEDAIKVIADILHRGNDAVIRRKNNGFVILEEKKSTKYDASAIGHLLGQ